MDAVEKNVRDVYDSLVQRQILDASELRRYATEEIWMTICRDPESVAKLYRNMHARAVQINMLQVILRKGQ